MIQNLECSKHMIIKLPRVLKSSLRPLLPLVGNIIFYFQQMILSRAFFLKKRSITETWLELDNTGKRLFLYYHRKVYLVYKLRKSYDIFKTFKFIGANKKVKTINSTEERNVFFIYCTSHEINVNVENIDFWRCQLLIKMFSMKEIHWD